MAKNEYKHAKDLPINTAAWRVVALSDRIMNVTDNNHKQTFGRKLVDTSFHILSLIGNARRTLDMEIRSQILSELIDEYYIIANTIKYLSESKYLGPHGEDIYVEAMPVLANLERQALGWFNKTQADILPAHE